MVGSADLHPVVFDTALRVLPDLGGGALMDVGCYCLSLIRLATGCAPRRVTAQQRPALGRAPPAFG